MTVSTSAYSRWNRFIANEPARIALFALIGVLAFLFVYGPATLDVTYTDWLMTGKDPTLHFLGWEFFRHDPWAFPLGKISGYGYPYGSSTTFTDSITLLALPFKALNPILPDKFQYFGVWSLVCFALQGISGGLLLSRFADWEANKNRLFAFIGTVFFVLSPIMLRPSHNALGGQWIVLLSLYLFFKSREVKISVLPWILVQALATFIMPYFTLMTLIIYIGHEIDDLLRNKKPLANLLRGAAVICSMVACGLLIGLFDVGDSSASRSQFGYYSMNLNALFNPMGWSSFIPALPTATEGQTAGFNYLGLGMLSLLLASSGIAVFAKVKGDRLGAPGIPQRGKVRDIAGLLFIVVSLFVFSLSNKITFFDHMLTIPLPGKILDICAIFRSSGRLFWPVYYLLYVFAFRTLFLDLRTKKSRLIAAVFAAAMLVLQVADMAGSPLLSAKVAQRSKEVEYHSPLRSEFWDDAARKYRHIVFLPPRIDDYDAFSFFAVKNGMTINTGYFARAHSEHIKRYAAERVADLRRGELDGENLYVIKDPALFKELSAIFNGKRPGYEYSVDGFQVLVAHPFSERAAE